MAARSKKLYVYRQAPLTGAWETVGLFEHNATEESGSFTYLEAYANSGEAQSIDPVNLAIQPGTQKPYLARRYGGLHDVLRDSSPDGWGQYLLCEFMGVKQNATDLEFFIHSRNTDRWGALAFGTNITPPIYLQESPTPPSIDLLVDELAAMEEGKSALDQRLRNRPQECSLGGARPKASLQDQDGVWWITKPRSRHDRAETPVIEYFSQTWASLIGIKVAETRLLSVSGGKHAALVRRFDRVNGVRQMCLSAASIMQYDYPGPPTQGALPPSYPHLASRMRDIGVPTIDRQELFARMVFNALCGNDDDHTRNHAIVFCPKEGIWRLSPAYDIVPGYYDKVRYLSMGTSLVDKAITLDNFLSNFMHFGFDSKPTAAQRIKEITVLAREAFKEVSSVLSQSTRAMAAAQLDFISTILDAEPAQKKPESWKNSNPKQGPHSF